MILVIGGAYQGKSAFVRERFSTGDIINGESCTHEDVFSAAAVVHFERLVRRIIPEASAADFARELCRRNPDVIVIADEIGGGIVPVEKQERLWREETGRALCVLAEFAETVIRVNCGIPVAIKGELL